MQKRRKSIDIGITIVAILMILFGIAEIATGFTNSFFGIVTVQGAASEYGAAITGTFYVLGGLFLITARKWAAKVSLLCIAGEIIGRIVLVATGIYPLGTQLQLFSIIAGTAIALIFAAYIAIRLPSLN